MKLLHAAPTETRDAGPDDEVIDLTGEQEPSHTEAPRPRARPLQARRADSGRAGRQPRGLRIHRVRLGSLASIAAVFWLLAFGVLFGTVVVVWSVVNAFGYVDSLEETIATSLALESFEIRGGSMAGAVAGGLAALCALGWVATLAVGVVFNAVGAAFGGLAVETRPLSRPRSARRPDPASVDA